MARRPSPDLQPTARPRLVERADGLARWDGRGAVGYVALAEALDARGRRPARAARGSSWSGAASPPAGSAGSPSASPARASCACSRRRRRPGSSTPTAARRCSGRTRSAWRCPGRAARRWSTCRWAASPTATSSRRPRRTSRSRPGSGVRARRLAEDDPAEIADRAGIVPFGGDQAHKGFALAVLVELLCRPSPRRRGFAAVALLAVPRPRRGRARPRERSAGGRFPGDAEPRRRDAALARGSIDRARRPVGLAQALTACGPSAGTRRDSTRDSPSPAIVTP